MPTTLPRFTDRPIDYYVPKFERRIYRRVFEYQVLAENFERESSEHSGELLHLLGIDRHDVQGMETKDHLEKACLVGLKAEFELFFYIYSHFVIDHIILQAESAGGLCAEHKGLLSLVEDKKGFFDTFVRNGFQDARPLFVERAVPPYGLLRMVGALEKAGWNVMQVLEASDHDDFRARIPQDIACRVDPIAQVKTAFQVRHAIEHSFSRVGRPFVAKTRDTWSHSTWCRLFAEHGSPKLGERITVSPLDIQVTAAAMTHMGRLVMAHWRETTEGRQA
jgi:hypothetical protein